MQHEEHRIGHVAQKILVLLLAGFALGFTYSPNRYWRIVEAARKDWENINRRALRRAIETLYKSKLIDSQDNKDGSTTINLTQLGKKKALTYQIHDMQIPPMKKWDRNWRIVLFDIPEKHKKARDALCRALKNMSFYQFQKSVFIHPFDCKNEIDFVIEFFTLRPYVRFILAQHIDNELHIKQYFDII